MIFDQDDRLFLDWLAANPQGFVVNQRRSLAPDYAVLHRSTCRCFITSTDKPPGGFTERGYVKLCAQTVDAAQELLVKAQRNPKASFSKACGLCNP